MPSQFKKVEFVSDGNKLSGSLYCPPGNKKSPGVIFLHGGGESSKSRFWEWQKHLAKIRICSFAFDFRGVGESQGSFSDGSLNNRFLDAVRALDYFISTGFVKKERVAIVGASMSAPIAIRLSVINEDIRALVLLSPAAYAKEAEDKKLDGEFTKVLRKENSWRNSQSFPALQKYKKPVALIYGDRDSVIPGQIKEKYRSCLKKDDLYLRIKNGQHNLLDPQNATERKTLDLLTAKLNEFLLRVFEKTS